MRNSPDAIAEAASRFRTDIQGLRAVAVVAVVLYHAGVPFLPGGYIGVDVFFVISGFLITSHLLTSLRRDGNVRFGTFYAKRVRRILPASFVVLALSIVAALVWYPPLLMREVWQGAVATAMYVPNVLFAVQGTDYLAEETPSLFQHYWSLGIEEQFYLVWPLVLCLAFMVARRPRVLFGLLTALVVTSFVGCLVLSSQSPPWAFFTLPARAWELGVGGLAAFALSYRPGLVKGTVAAFVGWLGVIGILGSALLFTSTTPFPGPWALLPVLSTAAVIVAGDRPIRHSPQAVLSLRPMMWVGLVSYSLYLVHWPLLQLPQAAAGYEKPLPLWVTLSLAALAFPIAYLMYRYIEEPGRNGRWLAAARPRRSLIAAAATSVAVAVLATGSFAYSQSRPLDAGRAAADTVLTTSPTPTRFVPTNLRPALRAASGDQPVTYELGCHLDFEETAVSDCVFGDPSAPRIALFGDSHAAQWFPALLGFAQANGFSVESHTKSSCPSVSADVLRDGVAYRQCSEWRESVFARIQASKPALTVVTNYGVAALADDGGNYGETWGRALEATLARINTPVVVIADTPDLGTTPSVCLSAHLDAVSDCSRSRSAAMSAPSRESEQRVAVKLGVPYVDLTDFLCAEKECAPILGNTLVYRDSHHLTATFSSLLADPLGKQLSSALASTPP